MAGFRTFATGEVLTAANVNNFLMKQSVMVFADASARTAALGAEVTEGMLTFNKDTGALEVFDGTNFVAAGAEPPAGIGSNVVQTNKTNTFTTSSSSFVDVTDLSVTITPSSATSKILVLAQLAVSSSEGRNIGNVSVGGAEIYALVDNDTFNSIRVISHVTGVVLHAPATTSPVTYQIRVRDGSSGTTRVNNGGAGVSNLNTSSLTAIEVAA